MGKIPFLHYVLLYTLCAFLHGYKYITTLMLAMCTSQSTLNKTAPGLKTDLLELLALPVLAWRLLL